MHDCNLMTPFKQGPHTKQALPTRQALHTDVHVTLCVCAYNLMSPLKQGPHTKQALPTKQALLTDVCMTLVYAPPV